MPLSPRQLLVLWYGLGRGRSGLSFKLGYTMVWMGKV